MTREDIIRMAQEADVWVVGQEPYQTQLERFAALVADAEAKRIHDEGMVTVGHMREQIAAEREACARACEEMQIVGSGEHGFLERSTIKDCVETIRARGQA